MPTSNLLLQMTPSDPRWVSFLDGNADISIFHHPAWMQLIAKSYGYRPFVLALTNAQSGVVAGIPLMEVNSPFIGRRWVSLPFSDCCRPVSRDESTLKALTEQVLRSAASRRIRSVELRGTYPVHQSLYARSGHVIHKLDLTSGLNAIWRNVHAMHRRNVRIATENDVAVICGGSDDHLADFYRLHLVTRRRQGMPIQPWRFFMHLKELLLDQGHGFLMLAYKNRDCIAGAIFLYWGDTFTYKYGASNDDNSGCRPNNIIMWAAIQRACERGFRYFDLGRTDLENTGLRTFKSRWGAKEIPLFYSSLKTNSFSVVGGRLMRCMHFVIQKSPTWLCRLTGEFLYKYFG